MAQIVTINGRQWVAGLSWVSYEEVPPIDKLEEDGELLRADWHALRIGEEAIQGGFCEAVPGIENPRKLYSLAAMLADSNEQPWMGWFRLDDDLLWFVAVRDHHSILPTGDVIGTEAEVFDARERLSGHTDWKYIEGDRNDLGKLIDGIKTKRTPVRLLHEHKGPSVAIAVAAACVLATGGAYWWYHKKTIEEQERIVAMARMRAALLAQQKAMPAPPPPSPLLSTPEPMAVLDACGRALLDLPMSDQGWALTAVQCSQTAATVTWTMEGFSTVRNRPEGALAEDGKRSTQTIPFSIEQRGANNAIPLRDARVALQAWAQEAQIPVTKISTDDPQSLPAAGAPEAKGLPPVIPQMTYRFDLPFTPFSLDFSSIPGFRISSLKMTEKGWELIGVIYGSY